MKKQAPMRLTTLMRMPKRAETTRSTSPISENREDEIKVTAQKCYTIPPFYPHRPSIRHDFHAVDITARRSCYRRFIEVDRHYG